LELDYEDDLHQSAEEETPETIVLPPPPGDKVDALALVVAGMQHKWQEFADSFKSTTESSKKKKFRLGRTPSPVPQASGVPASEDRTPPSSPSKAESASSTFRSAVSLVASRKRTSSSLVDVSGSPTRPGEDRRVSLPALALHPLVKDWFSLATTKLDDPAVKPGSPFEQIGRASCRERV
jgi:hypothetical protein